MRRPFLAANWKMFKDVDAAVKYVKELLAKSGDKLVLPTDAVVAPTLSADAPASAVARDRVPADQAMFDVGPDSVRQFAEIVRGAKTVLWNGPMGVFEMAPFAAGTMGVAQAVSRVYGTTIIGGGDSVAAVTKAGVADKMTHISTGGGASLEFLGGQTLPGVAALMD